MLSGQARWSGASQLLDPADVLVGESLGTAKAAGLMRGVEPGEIPVLVDELNGRYADNGCLYRIVSEGAGYRLSLDRSFHGVRM